MNRTSTELNGLLKLMFDGTLSSGPPALHGAGAGHAGSEFHSLMIVFSWLLFFTLRPSELRARIGSRAPSDWPLSERSGKNVSAGTPDPNVYSGDTEMPHGIWICPYAVNRCRSSLAA